MKEVRYWLAEDNTMFDDEYDCIRYERQKKLENYKNDFVFYDEQKNIIFPEEANADQIFIVVIKTPDAAKYVGEWFKDDGCCSPFDGCEFGHEVGTWVYGDLLEMGGEWVKLEAEIERLQNFLNEIK